MAQCYVRNMKEIDQKLDQWIHSSIIKAEIRKIIMKERIKQYTLGVEAALDHKINTND